MSKVAIINGQDRYQNIHRALMLIKEEVREKIKGKQRIVIKPNLCVAGNQLAVTNVESVRAVLDFLRQEFDVSHNIKIAEGPFESGGLERCLESYGYRERLADYPVEFVDLNKDDYKEFEISLMRNYAKNACPKCHIDGRRAKLAKMRKESVKLKLARTILDSDFLISICPAKTHDAVITTLAIKNVVVGSIVVEPSAGGGYHRGIIHGSPYKINKIISSVAQYIMPDLAIIDGTKAMEGNGPTGGKRVDWGIVIGSLDAVAADSVCSYLMGFDPKDIGYLYYLGVKDLKELEILGIEDIEKYKRKFKPHSSYDWQLKWQK